jgi:hypothetical protein
MKKFYNAVMAEFEKEAIIELFTAQSISPVKYIDLYAGQDQFEENFELFQQNALLVEWEIDYEGDTPIATITLYCCFEQLRDTSNISQNKALALQFLDYVDTIAQVVESIETESTGKPELISEGFNKMDSIVDIYLLTYQCSYTGRTKANKYQDGEFETFDVGKNLVQKFDFDFDFD